jgi:hypothetical protein
MVERREGERIVNPGADFRAPGADRVGMAHTKL